MQHATYWQGPRLLLLFAGRLKLIEGVGSRQLAAKCLDGSLACQLRSIWGDEEVEAPMKSIIRVDLYWGVDLHDTSSKRLVGYPAQLG